MRPTVQRLLHSTLHYTLLVAQRIPPCKLYKMPRQARINIAFVVPFSFPFDSCAVRCLKTHLLFHLSFLSSSPPPPPPSSRCTSSCPASPSPIRSSRYCDTRMAARQGPEPEPSPAVPPFQGFIIEKTKFTCPRLLS
jgi:hypothetical protein